MNYDIVEALSQIAREKGVDLQVLKDRVEASLLSAARKKHGINAAITITFDGDQGGIEMHMTKTTRIPPCPKCHKTVFRKSY